MAVEFTGDAFSELANYDWSEKIKTSGECKVSKLPEADKARYQLVCDNGSVGQELQLFLGNSADYRKSSWLLVKDNLSINGNAFNADGNISFNTIKASDVEVNRSLIEDINVSWPGNNKFNKYNLGVVFREDVFQLYKLTKKKYFSINNCDISVDLNISNIIERSVTIYSSHCHKSRDIIINYPEQYQPIDMADMNMSTTFVGCAGGKDAKYLGGQASAESGWKFSGCTLDAHNDNKLKITIHIANFAPAEHEFNITKIDIFRSKTNKIINIYLENDAVAAMLQPLLVSSAKQPVRSENEGVNSAPNYRLSAVQYKRSPDGVDEECKLSYVNHNVNGANPTLPNLHQARCDSLPTHISYQYKRIDDHDDSTLLSRNKAYQSTWNTNYQSLSNNDLSYHHSKLKRKLQIELEDNYKSRIDRWQNTHLGIQHDQNGGDQGDIDGKWAHFVYADPDCNVESFIGRIDAKADFTNDREDDYNMTWPLYARLDNKDEPEKPFSNCAIAIVEEDRSSKANKQAQVVAFDMQTRFPAGAKVVIIVAISDDLRGHESANVAASVRESLRDLLGKIVQKNETPASTLAANVNVIEITSEGRLEFLFDESVSADKSDATDRRLGQISTAAPANPRITDIRNNDLVREAVGGWLLLLTGSSYDDEMFKIYGAMAKKVLANDSENHIEPNAPNRIKLFTLNYCDNWKRDLMTMRDDFRKKELVQCQNIAELDSEFRDSLESAINELLWANN